MLSLHLFSSITLGVLCLVSLIELLRRNTGRFKILASLLSLNTLAQIVSGSAVIATSPEASMQAYCFQGLISLGVVVTLATILLVKAKKTLPQP